MIFYLGFGGSLDGRGDNMYKFQRRMKLLWIIVMVVSVNGNGLGATRTLPLGPIKLPVYPKADDISFTSDAFIINNCDAWLAIFSSGRGRGAVKGVTDFYREHFKKAGWREERGDLYGEFLRWYSYSTISPEFLEYRDGQLQVIDEETYYKLISELADRWCFYKDDMAIGLEVVDTEENDYIGDDEGIDVLLFLISPWYGKKEGVNMDAPGCDPLNMPRCPGSIRKMSVLLKNGACQIYVYTTRTDIDGVRRYYEGVMPGYGWERLGFLPILKYEDTYFLVFMKELDFALITISDLKNSEDTVISITLMSERQDSFLGAAGL